MKWLLITTIGKNPGDEWIRIGIQKIINEIDPDNECILLDKEEPSKYKIPLEFDKCIWCGMPVFWSLAEEQNCKIFWWKDLMFGWPSERRSDFMVLGAGSFFPWGKELETITYKEQLAKSAQDILNRSYCVTARDHVVSKVTNKSIPYMICPAVFSVIDYKKSRELKLANIMPQGSHYAVFGSQEAAIWNKKKYEISKILQQNDFTCVAHNQKEIQFAQNCGWEKIISYNGNPYELLDYYGCCGKYFGNRVHGAIIARGNDADVWSVGYDSRQEAVKLSGARISKPSELNLDEIANWAASDIKAEPFAMDLEFEKQKEIVKRFMLAGKTSPKTQSKPISDSSKKRILFVRTDSIGDNVLASSILPHIYEKYGNPEITVVCQEHIAQLYQHCPYVNDIITFNRKQAVENESYRNEIVGQLRAFKPDIAMNSVFSREPLTDIFTIASQAKELIALEGDLSNISAEIKNKHDQFYTKLLPSEGENKTELLRHKDFLAGFNIDAKSLKPVVWTTREDEKFAEEFFETNGLEPEKTIALFPAAQHCHKFYDNYKTVLQNFREFNFLILGGNDAKEYAAEICGNFPDNCKDLTGKTTICQMAEIIKKCRLYLGADSAGVHIACVVGTENVALLGGGHFGRFIPYSNLTSIVCLPLDCFGGNWKCKYQKAHCVNGIEPKVVDCAIRQTLQRKSDRPRIFVQGNSLWQPQQNQPLWQAFDGMLDTDSVEIIPVGEIPQQTYQNWQGKLCSQKGKFAEAIKHFTKALKVNPYDRNTVLNCGKILSEHNKIQEAKTLYNCYLQKYPDDKKILDSLAKLRINKTAKTDDGDEAYLVSAIVSTYNAEKFIRGCLEDLENQTIADKLEIIIVNSGLEQNEEKIVKEFQQKYKNIVYIKTDQREGIYSAWNRAVKIAKGKFITNANTDDRHSKNALEIMANELLANCEVGLVYGDQIRTKTPNDTFENNCGTDVMKQPEYSHERLLFGCCTGSQPMWRKSFHDKIGYFDETLTCAGDKCVEMAEQEICQSA